MISLWVPNWSETALLKANRYRLTPAKCPFQLQLVYSCSSAVPGLPTVCLQKIICLSCPI